MTRPDRAGFTLIEVVVALAIVALTASLAALAFRGEAHTPSRAGRIEAARQQALEGRRPVPFSPDSGATELLALPDGRVLGDSANGVDPLTGRPRAQP
ncbi:MAG TPA: prepilin-type N-terminal cleavage/methylation domain-containing protein [Longimicrobium sp.]|jgi:prepilin-type N-terminal cleavage/methylation domain-containing protein